MGDGKATAPSVGVMGALSIGIGGIVGGGFFATFGLTIEGAKGGTPLAFLIGGLVALLTAYSYIPLTLRYPGPVEPWHLSVLPSGGVYLLRASTSS